MYVCMYAFIHPTLKLVSFLCMHCGFVCFLRAFWIWATDTVVFITDLTEVNVGMAANLNLKLQEWKLLPMGYSSPAIWPLVLWEQLVLLSSLGVTLYLQQVDCAALRDLFRTSFGPGVRAELQAGPTKIIRWGRWRFAHDRQEGSQ